MAMLSLRCNLVQDLVQDLLSLRCNLVQDLGYLSGKEFGPYLFGQANSISQNGPEKSVLKFLLSHIL